MILLALLHACREACILIFLDPYLTLDRLIEGNLSLCLLYIRDLLDSVQEDLHEVVVVKAEELDQQGVLSGYEMTLHNFGDLLQ